DLEGVRRAAREDTPSLAPAEPVRERERQVGQADPAPSRRTGEPQSPELAEDRIAETLGQPLEHGDAGARKAVLEAVAKRRPAAHARPSLPSSGSPSRNSSVIRSTTRGASTPRSFTSSFSVTTSSARSCAAA